MDESERHYRTLLEEAFAERAKRDGVRVADSDSFPEELRDPATSDYIQAVLQFIGSDVDGKDVLEVGVGSGLLTCELAKRVSHLTSIDISDEMIEKARRASSAFSDRIVFHRIFLQDYQLRIHDVAVCSRVLGHQLGRLFPAAAAVLTQVAPVLFLFEHTGGRVQASNVTQVRPFGDLVEAFAGYTLERRQDYQYVTDAYSFLKLVRH